MFVGWRVGKRRQVIVTCCVLCPPTPIRLCSTHEAIPPNTLMEAGKGGSESAAVTVSARMRPSASESGTSSASSAGACASTVACASGMLIILYFDDGGPIVASGGALR